jgi:hypothetical protein
MAVIIRALPAAPMLCSGAIMRSAARAAAGLPLDEGSAEAMVQAAGIGPVLFPGVSGCFWTIGPAVALSEASTWVLVLDILAMTSSAYVLKPETGQVGRE